jgi:exosome complex component RRP42
MSDGAKAYLLGLLDKGKRMDGRAILDIRKPVTVEYGISKTAEGSAKVTIGDTQVLAGVKMEVGVPYPDTPDKGTIMVGAELIPLSSPEFEPGPPSMKAIELARVVDRGIRESKALDFKKMCIQEGEKVWNYLIDVVTLNDAGNLIDASGLAALAALKDAKYPEFDGEKIDYKAKTDKGIDLLKEPIPVTVFKIGKYFIVDPTTDEEKLVEARLTITTTSDGTLCALQKGGDLPLSMDDISQMIDIAKEKVKILKEAL